jgi:cytochrome c-type biogenesis protein CcmH/NrfG
MFTRAVDLAPNFANARWFLASVYEEQGDFGKAIEQMEAISATSPDLPIVSARLERLKAGKAAAEAPAPIEEVAE